MLLTMAGMPAMSQEVSEGNHMITDDHYVNVDVRARADFQQQFDDGKIVRSNSGFEGKNLSLIVNGSIIPGLDYAWRQRFNKALLDGNFFDATDYIYISWHVKDWHLSAGKQVVGIGGWEYDRAPIDIMMNSIFNSNVRCYEFGVSAAYDFNKKTRLMAQVNQSPFWTKENRDMYTYNLYFTGNYGFYHAIHSVNFLNYAKGKYISYIALGNKFDIGDKVTLELDFMNRAASHQAYFFKDCSVIGELAYKPGSRWNIFGKIAYDVNKSGTDADMIVQNGTEITLAGIGAEFYPLKRWNTNLRIHANVFYSWGHNPNTADLMHDKSLMCDVGITWFMHVYKLNRNKK